MDTEMGGASVTLVTRLTITAYVFAAAADDDT